MGCVMRSMNRSLPNETTKITQVNIVVRTLQSLNWIPLLWRMPSLRFFFSPFRFSFCHLFQFTIIIFAFVIHCSILWPIKTHRDPDQRQICHFNKTIDEKKEEHTFCIEMNRCKIIKNKQQTIIQFSDCLLQFYINTVNKQKRNKKPIKQLKLNKMKAYFSLHRHRYHGERE